MRGRGSPQLTMLTFVNLDERAPPNHPLRVIKRVADDVLHRMSGDFDTMYSKIGRASVPPERLLKSLLLISLYSIRSERGEHRTRHGVKAGVGPSGGLAEGPGPGADPACARRGGDGVPGQVEVGTTVGGG